DEMDLVLEIHAVDARLHLEPARLDAEAAFNVMRSLGLQLEIPGNWIEEGVERRSQRNTLIDVRGTERACGAAEHREYVVEAMLEAGMQRVLCFVAVQWGGLRAAVKKQRAIGRVGVVPIPGTQAGVLNPGAVGEIGRRQQAQR